MTPIVLAFLASCQLVGSIDEKTPAPRPPVVNVYVQGGAAGAGGAPVLPGGFGGQPAGHGSTGGALDAGHAGGPTAGTGGQKEQSAGFAGVIDAGGSTTELGGEGGQGIPGGSDGGAGLDASAGAGGQERPAGEAGTGGVAGAAGSSVDAGADALEDAPADAEEPDAPVDAAEEPPPAFVGGPCPNPGAATVEDQGCPGCGDGREGCCWQGVCGLFKPGVFSCGPAITCGAP